MFYFHVTLYYLISSKTGTKTILESLHKQQHDLPKTFLHIPNNEQSYKNYKHNLSKIHTNTSSGWWSDILITSGCHDSPGAIGTLQNVAPNNDCTSTFKPSMHCGKGKYEATTCTTESQRITYFHKRKHSEVKEKAENDCTKQIHPSIEH